MSKNPIVSHFEDNIVILDERFSQEIKKYAMLEYNLGQMEELKILLNNHGAIDIHHAIIGLRKIITSESRPVEEFISAQIVPRIMQLALLESHPHIQHEAMVILTNITSGTRQQVSAFVQIGAISIFSYLVLSKVDNVVCQAIWALGKISQYSSQYRDLVIIQGLPRLNKRLKECMHEEKMFFKKICWTVGTIFRVRPMPHYQAIRETILNLLDVLQKKNWESTTHEMFWAICYCSNEKEIRDKILNSLVIYELLSGLRHRSPSALLATLIILQKIIEENVDNINIIMSKNAFFLDDLVYLLTQNLQTAHLTKIVEIFGVISEGDSNNIESLCKTRQLLMRLYEGVTFEDIQVFKILKIFRNIMHHGSIQSIEQLFQVGRIIDIFAEGDDQYLLTSCQCFYQLMLLRFHHNLGDGIIMQTIQEVYQGKDKVLGNFEVMVMKQDQRMLELVERIKVLMLRLQFQQ